MTNVARSLKPLNLVKKRVSLFLIADSVSLNYNPGIKEFKIPTL